MKRKIERTNNVKVIKNEENPETPEVLAASLIQIGNAMKQLSKQGGLNEEAIVALVSNMRGMSQIPKSEISLVFSALNRLQSYYIRK